MFSFLLRCLFFVPQQTIAFGIGLFLVIFHTCLRSTQFFFGLLFGLNEIKDQIKEIKDQIKEIKDRLGNVELEMRIATLKSDLMNDKLYEHQRRLATLETEYRRRWALNGEGFLSSTLGLL